MLDATETARLIANGETTAVQTTQDALDRIAAQDGELHAFITVDADGALAAARAADAAQQRGEPLGPLHGVPLSLKDEVWTKGLRSTAGSLLYADFVPEVDSAAVVRLRNAGAIIVGKAQMPEFAAWPQSKNLVAPEAVNPHDGERISGASSGGSAVGVAAGMVPMSLGSDGGGSIRIPSALCGTFGLFPTPGLVPARDSFSYSPFASLGPITRTVRDAALMLQVLAGHDPLEVGSLDTPVPDYLATLDSGVEGLRIAFTPDFGWIDADRRIVALTAEIASRLTAAGAAVATPEIVLPDIWPVFGAVTLGASLYDDIRTPFMVSPDHVGRLLNGLDQLTPPLQASAAMTPPTPEQYADAMHLIDAVREQLRTWFEQYDVICSPTMAMLAPVSPQDWAMPYPDGRMGTNYTSYANVCRLAAASYPCGLIDGLPAGLQVMGRGGAEATVLRVCRALEQVAPYHGLV